MARSTSWLTSTIPADRFPALTPVFKGIQFVPSLAPTATASGGTASFTEGSSPAAVDPGVTFGDPDAVASDISSATVQITNNFVAGEDVLASRPQRAAASPVRTAQARAP